MVQWYFIIQSISNGWKSNHLHTEDIANRQWQLHMHCKQRHSSNGAFDSIPCSRYVKWPRCTKNRRWNVHKSNHANNFDIRCIFTVDLPDEPIATYQPRDQYIELGQEARLYCEAFVGSIPLPDSKNTIIWFQTTENGQEEIVEQDKFNR